MKVIILYNQITDEVCEVVANDAALLRSFAGSACQLKKDAQGDWQVYKNGEVVYYTRYHDLIC